MLRVFRGIVALGGRAVLTRCTGVGIARGDAISAGYANLIGATVDVAATRRHTTTERLGLAAVGLTFLIIRARQARAVGHARAVLTHEVVGARSKTRLLTGIAQVNAFAGYTLLTR